MQVKIICPIKKTKNTEILIQLEIQRVHHQFVTQLTCNNQFITAELLLNYYFFEFVAHIER